MEIHINEQPLSFTLEEERNLGDILKALEKWLGASSLVLTSARFGSRELLSSPPEEWADTPIDSVSTLQLTVRHLTEATITNLETLMDYLNMLQASLTQKHDKLFQNLQTSFPSMVDGLQRLFPGDMEADLAELGTCLLSVSAHDLFSSAGPDLSKPAELIHRISSRVSRRLLELHDPRQALKDLTGEMAGSISEIREVPVLLQMGKDRKAMESIVRFSELSQSVIRIFSNLEGSQALEAFKVADKSLKEFYQELNGILTQVISAFTAQDSVLIGDLMEYEVVPRLEALRNAIQAWQ